MARTTPAAREREQEAARLPDDPAAFVAAAARGINAYDLDATAGSYAEGAVMESITDGAYERFEGATAIRQAWQGYLDGMRATRFQLEKSIVSATDGVLVNTYHSTFRGRTRGRGIETWRFDPQGRVAEHTMYTFFEVRPSTSLVQRARLLFAHPQIALALLRATAKS